jgi:hypothetical protein
MRSSDQKTAGIMFGAAVQDSSAQNPALIFHRYARTYFLSQVRAGFGWKNVELAQSKAERMTARQWRL